MYRCRLRDGGQEVAVKVQRPDMIRAVSLDLYLVRRYMHLIEWFKNEGPVMNTILACGCDTGTRSHSYSLTLTLLVCRMTNMRRTT